MNAYEKYKSYADRTIKMGESEMALLRANSRVRRLRKRQNLLLEGDHSKYLAWVASGCLRLYMLDSAGNDRIVEFAMEDGYVTDRSSFLTGGPSPYYIDAVTESEVVLFTFEELGILAGSIPGYAHVLRRGVAGVLAKYQTRILTTLSLSAEEKYKVLQEQDAKLLQAVPQHMIANYLGLTPATLSRLRRKQQDG